MSRSPPSVAEVQAHDRRRNSRNAFTLIELLAVVAIIVVLVGGLGYALRGRGSEGAALASAQRSVASLIGAARAQAALHQTSARLLLYAVQPPQGDAAKYLRYFQVVREQPAGAGAWVSSGDPVVLPSGIFIVPPRSVPASHLATGVTWPGGPFAPVSNLAGPIAITVDRRPFGGVGGGRAYYLEYSADGRLTVAPPLATRPTLIALSTAVAAANALPRFNNASAVRGLLLRVSGAVTSVNDANSF